MAAAVILCLGYVIVVELLAAFVYHDQRDRIGRDLGGDRLQRQGRLAASGEIPTLARWDSFWYFDLADQGYRGDYEESEFSAGFLPLYPWLMRTLRTFGADLFSAGLCISRLALLTAIVLLCGYPRKTSGNGSPLAPAAALLAFPSAFLLVSVYSEALFLALCLAAFVASRKSRYAVGAAMAFLAGLTRINGLALIPALLVLAWEQGRQGDRTPQRYLPAIGAALAPVVLAAIFYALFGDALAYSHAKRDNWGTRIAPPWVAIQVALERVDHALVAPNLSSLCVLLELPCLELIVVAAAILCFRRQWPEAVFLVSSIGLTLISGSTWGLPRFVLPLFPVFLVLAELSRHKPLWYLYLIGSTLLQAAMLIVYVSFRNPAP